MALKAVQELLGHEWLKTTTVYVHVHDDHIERAWSEANNRVASRFNLTSSTTDTTDTRDTSSTTGLVTDAKEG